jgi:Fic-DOC domain mobile mystery protein B
MITYHYIAGQTPLDEEEKRGLIPSLITREDLDSFEQENILEARQWIMQPSVLARQELFSETFVCKLHRRMYGHVWKWAGTFRTSDKNIGVDYYRIPLELRQLLEDAAYWREHQSYSIEDIAVIYHHRLVKIHLFPNGNGRHARMCADSIAVKYGKKPFSWGGADTALSKPDMLRARYIAALRDADRGFYEPLLAFARQ